MGDIIEIAFQGGTHGHFLMYFLDRCSKLTPELKELPFDDSGNGTSHKKINYSGKFNCYHPMPEGVTIGWEPIWKHIERPHIFITIEKEDIHFIERWVNIRAGNHNIDIDKDSIEFSDLYLSKVPIRSKLKELYGCESNTVPRFIIRDLYKHNYLDLDQNGFILRDKMYRKQLPNKNTFLFPVAAFWNEEMFRQKIQEVDNKFNLNLEFDKKVYDMFIQKLPWIKTKDRVFTIIDAIKQNKDINIEDIDTVQQAFVGAWIEQNYEFITIPLSNGFWKTTGEIIQWLKYYPQHYKAMNPNLPTFNGIPNPFHLAKLKK